MPTTSARVSREKGDMTRRLTQEISASWSSAPRRIECRLGAGAVMLAIIRERRIAAAVARKQQQGD